MKVLFDWDNPNLSGKWAIRQGIYLIVYGVLKFLGVNFPREIANETDDYASTILKLNDMLGVETVIGIRDPVKAAKTRTVEKMVEAGCDVRRHIHIGKNSDPNRQRLWEPLLKQTPHTWHYDIDYVAGKPMNLLPGELPLWHFDRPYHLKNYIDFLYNEFHAKE